jgi:hypothetical protein
MAMEPKAPAAAEAHLYVRDGLIRAGDARRKPSARPLFLPAADPAPLQTLPPRPGPSALATARPPRAGSVWFMTAAALRRENPRPRSSRAARRAATAGGGMDRV